MFGRKNNDDYDDYNEKYAAKYDDDYIAPSKECRDECEHSHEQSYSNINEVRECDHGHEQTYEDADSEQKPYDKRAGLENSMEKLLAPNEHLLWAGGDPKALANKSVNVNGFFSAGVLMLFIGIVLAWWLALAALVLLMSGICLMVRNSACAYAVTDIRVIAAKKDSNVSVPLGWIRSVSSTSSGYLILQLFFAVNSAPGNRTKTKSFMMYRVSDAPRVKRIIEDASAGARISKM